MLREEEEEGLEKLSKVLVEEELLIPDKNFMESLEADKQGVKKAGEVSVPKQLQKLWTEFVGLIDRGLGVAALIDRLMEINTAGESEGKGGEESGWTLDSKQAWETLPLGGWQTQGWESLWVEGEWAKEDNGEELENLPD